MVQQHQNGGEANGRSTRGGKADDILEAAREAFLARGFAATRLDDIASRAGVAKGTLYLYFDSKEDLFQSLVRAAIVPNIAQMEALSKEWGGPASELLARFAQLALGVARDDQLSAIPRLLLAEARTFPDLARFYYQEVARRGLGLLSGVIAKGVARGEFRDVDPLHAARLVVAPFLMHAIWQAIFGPFDEHPIDPDAFAKTHLETLLNGLRANPGSSS